MSGTENMQKFFKSRKGQVSALVLLIVVVVGVWAAVFLRMSGGGAPLATAGGAIQAGSAAPQTAGAPATPDAAPGGAGSRGGASADSTADQAKPKPDPYQDDIFLHRNPFQTPDAN